LRLENLEHRAMLAGDVTTQFAGGNLVIRGDAEDNNIQIEASAEGDLVVSAGDSETDSPTTIDGETTFSGVSSVIVMLGDGDDTFEVGSGEVDGNVIVVAGAGDDTVTLGGDAEASTGDDSPGGDGGDDTGGNALAGDPLVEELAEPQLIVGGNLIVSGGQGDDTVTATNVMVEGDVSVLLAAGDDEVTLDAVTLDTLASGELKVITGAGDDVVSIDGFLGAEADVHVTTGQGDDEITMLAMTAANLKVDAGDGDNIVSIGMAEDDSGDDTGDDLVDDVAALSSIDIEAKVDVQTGSGDDTISMASLAAADFRVRTGRGDDVVIAADLSGDRLRLNTGAGLDVVSIDGSADASLERLNIQLGQGDDLLTLTGLTGSLLRLNAGNGDNVIDLNQLDFDRFFARLGQGDDLLDISPDSDLPLDQIVDAGRRMAGDLLGGLAGQLDEATNRGRRGFGLPFGLDRAADLPPGLAQRDTLPPGLARGLIG
jgi:hypothetical protein